MIGRPVKASDEIFHFLLRLGFCKRINASVPALREFCFTSDFRSSKGEMALSNRCERGGPTKEIVATFDQNDDR